MCECVCLIVEPVWNQKNTGSTLVSKAATLAFRILISFFSELEMEGWKERREGGRDGRKDEGSEREGERGGLVFSTEAVEALPHSSLGDKHQCST